MFCFYSFFSNNNLFFIEINLKYIKLIPCRYKKIELNYLELKSISVLSNLIVSYFIFKEFIR